MLKSHIAPIVIVNCKSIRTLYDNTKVWGVFLLYIQEVAVYLAFSAAFCFYPAILICTGLYLESFCDQVIDIYGKMDNCTQSRRFSNQANALLRDAIQLQMNSSM